MKESIRRKLDQIQDRFEEITGLLADPEVQSEQDRYRSLSQEYAQLEPVMECYRRYRESEEELESARELLSDAEMAELARESIEEARQRQQELEPELQRLLL
ncbi:MAG TPA: PCRF domain-containing protein, partial [Chromatiaceae bacterium]|nr:PCRF domain-containing protein [Chromatiaceae bacterium]